MSLRLCHVSDTHGRFPRLLGAFDAVVHTGDMSPNFDYDSKEVSNQMTWWEQQITIMRARLGGRDFLFTLGNHDYFNGFWLEGMLISNGIRAKCLHDQVYTYGGVNFYGFPYVPPINGKYAFESTTDQMDIHLKEMENHLTNSYVDVIAAHCPPYGFLDLSVSGARFGNTQMNTFLDYKLPKERHPNYYLCGHIHDAHGLMMRDGMLISNAAVTHNIIEV